MCDGVILGLWVRDELKIPGISPDADFSYVYRGDLVKVWSYLIENVMSKANAQHIQKSLQLYQASNSSTGRCDISHFMLEVNFCLLISL